jgi:hypothetical protein
MLAEYKRVNILQWPSLGRLEVKETHEHHAAP